MMNRLTAVLKDAVECRCRPNLDDIDAQNILFAFEDNYQLRAKVAELQSSHDALEAKLEKYENLEPVVWWNENTCQFFIGDILDVERKDLFKPLYALEK